MVKKGRGKVWIVFIGRNVFLAHLGGEKLFLIKRGGKN